MGLWLEARDLAKSFGNRRALQGASLESERGEVTVVLGPSGSGKTTLLRILALLLPPDTGEVRFAGERVGVEGAPAGPTGARQEPRAHGLTRRVGWVGQKPLVFRATTAENVAYGLRARGVPEQEREARVELALKQYGLSSLADEPARRLSGGEQQRIAFARAMVLEPHLLVLDEFTANLDPGNVARLERAVQRAAAEGTTVVAAAHDLHQARRIADRVLVLLEGRAADAGPLRQVFGAPRDGRVEAFLRGELVAPELPRPRSGP